MRTLTGQLFTGKTTTPVEVSVEAQPDGLRLTAPSLSEAWPYKRVHRLDAPAGRIRLGLRVEKGEEEPRLTLRDLTAEDLRALKSIAPGVFGGWGETRRIAVIAGGLVAGSALMIGMIIYGLPRAAGPAARATPPPIERSIGKSVRTYVNLWTNECPNDTSEGVAALAEVTERLNAIARSKFEIKIEIVDADFPNAFALPGGQIIVTDDLIEMADGPDEVAGVLAHELAHVKRRHVLATVYRQVGAVIFFEAMLGGGTGAGQEIALAANEFLALGYSREAEREADAFGLDYLEQAGFDPGGLGRFFAALSTDADDEDRETNRLHQLLSTHPDLKDRADAALARALPGREPALNEEQWTVVKTACHGDWRAEDIEDEEAAPDGDADGAERVDDAIHDIDGEHAEETQPADETREL